MNPRPRTLIGGQVGAEAAGFADQSVAALADAVKAGWAYPGELRKPDFDALRGREDFQKLFAGVEAKAEKGPETAPPRGRRSDRRSTHRRGCHESGRNRVRPSSLLAGPGRTRRLPPPLR
jgi:hypothetical protein